MKVTRCISRHGFAAIAGCMIAVGLIATTASCERSSFSTRAERRDLMKRAGAQEPTLFNITDVLTKKMASMASQETSLEEKEAVSLLFMEATEVFGVRIFPITEDRAKKLPIDRENSNHTNIGIPEIRLATIFFSPQNQDSTQGVRGSMPCGPNRFGWASLLMGMAAEPDTVGRGFQWVFSRRCIGIPDTGAQQEVMDNAVFPGADTLREELLNSIENGTFSTFADMLEPRVRAILVEAGVPLDSPGPR